jgi:putative DNA methylase
MDRYCKRLIEVDLPIKEISKHARREKNMRRGHVPMLHIWPATRPTSACRSVICASLWIDPADELCPNSYRLSALNEMLQFSKVATENRDVAELCSEESWKKYQALLRIEDKEITNDLNFQKTLRELLFSFIVDLASWEASTNNVFLSTARNITALSHNAINGTFSDKPLVIDSYAGGGSYSVRST